MKGTTKTGLGLVLISLIVGVFYLIQFVLAPSIMKQITVNGSTARQNDCFEA